MINWVTLTSDEQLESLKTRSFIKPQVLYKHSTRCGLSNVVLSRFERAGAMPDAEFYMLDLLKFRQLSNRIAADFNVYHESPQLLLIKNGHCIYDESHLGINMPDLNEQLISLN
ncbi:MAG TPA: bacillithiol system redox-active protein YtxJ [Panacibacter sp.]|nr:bacillithiol system redox-active protein YtxJ [Panacibacter sp.]HNP45950.1 bacillithiol system redox-active protein YtxJ [Panacibacter sp.]